MKQQQTAIIFRGRAIVSAVIHGLFDATQRALMWQGPMCGS